MSSVSETNDNNKYDNNNINDDDWIEFEKPVSNIVVVDKETNSVKRVNQKDSSSSGSSSSEYVPFRVVSWNILGDGPNLSMSDTKHGYCPSSLRLWKQSRLARTVSKIQQLNADFICLQECLPHMFHDLQTELSSDYEAFHMKDNIIHTIHDLLHTTTTTTTTDSLIHSNQQSIQDPNNDENNENRNDGTCSSQQIIMKKGKKDETEFGNAIFVRKKIIAPTTIGTNKKDNGSSLKLLWTKSGLFKDFASLLPACSGHRISGKARKRFLSCDYDGFLAIKFQSTNYNYHSSDFLLLCTHLYYDPNYPHVKALQAELLGHIAHICATHQFIRLSSTITNQQQKKKKTKSSSPNHTPLKEREQDVTVQNETSQHKNLPSCAIVIAGDLNTIPLFQPNFLPTTEEYQTMCNMTTMKNESTSTNDNKQRIHIENLPIEYQQSAVFRLFTNGRLESNHPEHPDTFGRGKANNISSSKKKAKLCGPLFLPSFYHRTQNAPTTSTNNDNTMIYDPNIHYQSFQLAYPYHHDSFVSYTINNKNIPHQLDLFPTKTTKVTDFEGVLDHILWTQYNTYDKNKDSPSPPILRQLGVLKIPDLTDPIPDETHTSDHLPVGMSFELLL